MNSLFSVFGYKTTNTDIMAANGKPYTFEHKYDICEYKDKGALLTTFELAEDFCETVVVVGHGLDNYTLYDEVEKEMGEFELM